MMWKSFNKNDAAQRALHDGMFFIQPKFNGGAVGAEKGKVVSGSYGTNIDIT